MIKLTNSYFITTVKTFRIFILYEFIYENCFILNTCECNFCTNFYNLIQIHHVLIYNFIRMTTLSLFNFEYILVSHNLIM